MWTRLKRRVGEGEVGRGGRENITVAMDNTNTDGACDLSECTHALPYRMGKWHYEMFIQKRENAPRPPPPIHTHTPVPFVEQFLLKNTICLRHIIPWDFTRNSRRLFF